MRRRSRALAGLGSGWLLLGLALALVCSIQQGEAERSAGEPSSDSVAAQAAYTDTGDLEALKARGRLRILVPRDQTRRGYLPRNGLPLDIEQRLAARFASANRLEPHIVYVDAFKDLIPALLAGKGDLIAANLTVTQDRKTQIDFTVPVGHTREQVVTRADDDKARTLADLQGRTVAVQPSTSFWGTLRELRRTYPDIGVAPLPPRLGQQEIIERVAGGKLDLAIVDSNILSVALQYRDDIRAALTLTGERALAWGVRPDNPKLLAALNRFLNREQLQRQPQETHTGDFAAIKARKTVRLLTRNNAATYFLWRGRLMGFEYELARAFARQHELRLQVVVAPSHEDLIPMLVEGRGDFVGAFLSPTAKREAMGARFSRPYHRASQLVVARSGEPAFKGPADLAGRTLVVRRSSAHWQTLAALKQRGIDLKLVAAPETLETEQIIDRVARGEYDLTIADGHILSLQLTWRDDVQSVLALGEPQPHAWAVRASNPELLEAINAFVKKYYRGLHYNLAYRKYFDTQHRVGNRRVGRLDFAHADQVSPFDAIVKRYAEQYGFDWRLIAAQMYQESRFDPQAKSWAGARGAMQVMPRTAQQLGFSNLSDPETGIHAGVRYLQWVRERFETELPIKDRLWFALAAYNAGTGHVRDARRLAEAKGWSPDRWFDNVERAMLLLSQKQYATRARHGYVRGLEPVNYVRDVRARYRAYVSLTRRARGAQHASAVEDAPAARETAAN